MAFVHTYQLNGQRYRKVVGSTVVYSVAPARLGVIKRKQQLKDGTDPEAGLIDTRRKHFLAVRDMIDQYWKSHVEKLSTGYRDSFALFVARWKRRGPKTATKRGINIRRSYTHFGTMFANKSFVAMKPMDIEQYQKQFTSPYSYNDGLARVSALFNWTIRMQLVDMRKPCNPHPHAEGHPPPPRLHDRPDSRDRDLHFLSGDGGTARDQPPRRVRQA
jgi:hypothetical protein